MTPARLNLPSTALVRASKILSLPALVLGHPFIALYHELQQYQQVSRAHRFVIDIHGAKQKQNTQ